MQPTEDALSTFIDVLDRSILRDDREERFDIVVALGELRAWLSDDRQSVRARSTNWVSLLRDVIAACEESGPRLSDLLRSSGVDAAAEVKDVLSAIRSRNEPPDPALRRRLITATDEALRLCGTPDARDAALDDAILAAALGYEDAVGAAYRLIALMQGPGLHGRWHTRHLSRVLTNDCDDTPRTIEQRVEDARTHVRAAPERVDIVIWRRIEYVEIGFPPIIRLGSDVRLFADAWFETALSNRSPQILDEAPEAQSDWSRLGQLASIETRGRSSDEDRIPAALLRVGFREEYVGRAHERALATAEALAGLACLYGAHPGTWLVDDAYCSYVNGESGGMGISADERRQIPAFPDLALESNQATHALARVGDALGPNLPIADEETADAGRLLHWLRQARLASAPPRILLHERVLEQVSGWAGVDDVHRFIRDYLRLEWVHSRMRRDVFSAASGTRFLLLRHSAYESLVAVYCDDPKNVQSPLNLRRFIGVADRARDAVEATIDAAVRRDNKRVLSRLGRVAEAQTSPEASRSWLERLIQNFNRLEHRRRRTRNSLTHGGPVVPATVESVVEFSEQLATSALGASIEGRLVERGDLIDYFLRVRRDYELMEKRLKAGDSLADALFPPQG